MRETDERDEWLGDVLDGDVAGLEPEDRVARVVRAGRLRWVGSATVALATAAAFVGVIGWAMPIVEEGPDATGPYGSAEDVTFEERNVPWSFRHPADWGTRTYERASLDGVTNMLITTVANWPIPDGGPYRPDPEDPSLLVATLGDGGAVVSVERFWSHETGATDAGEFGPGAFSPDPSSPGWEFRERARCAGTLCWHVLEWLGPEVSADDRAAAERIAESIGLAHVDRWTETDGVRTTLHDEEHGFTVTYPNEDWQVADENLTPTLTQPQEIASIGTFNMPTSKDGDGLRIFDAPVAPAALASMDPTDTFVSLQESGVVEGARDDRPARFAEGQEPEVLALDVPFDAYWTPFIDAGRGFYLFVAIGRDASPQTVDEAWAVADSLRFLASPSP